MLKFILKRKKNKEEDVQPELKIEEDMELDSPPFSPEVLKEFEAKSFIRQNKK